MSKMYEISPDPAIVPRLHSDVVQLLHQSVVNV